MAKGFPPQRHFSPPQPRDYLRFAPRLVDFRPVPARGELRSGKRSPRPEPRLPYKHALNPPIVTVIGGGVAGLTAAHELVERGFLVQLVESREDPFTPGRPLVGGVAANQPARVRANIEDLHSELLYITGSERDDSSESRIRVAGWLLALFAWNRGNWLSTEEPARLHRTIYTRDDPFQASLVGSLKQAREKCRAQWIWDLVLRTILTGGVKYANYEKLREEALKAFRDYSRPGVTNEALVLRIHELGFQPKGKRWERWILSLDDLKKHMEDLVIPALEREFLCFRLVPHACTGVARSEDAARELFNFWSRTLCEQFPHNCLSNPDDTLREQVAFKEAPPSFAHAAWLNLDVIEQRLPGEHGYRFFPSFYRHLDDTMQRTPLVTSEGQPTGRTAYDNLRPTVFQGMGFSGEDERKVAHLGGRIRRGQKDAVSERKAAKAARATVVELPRDRASSLEGLRDRTERFVQNIGGEQKDAVLLFAKLLRFALASPERRRQEYSQVTWQKFIELGGFSKVVQEHIQAGAQALLALSVDEVDARTYGNVALQLLLDQFRDGTRVDRTLNGPTSDSWLEPWRDYLEQQGVRFFCREVEALEMVSDDEEGELVPVYQRKGDRAERIVSQDGYELLTHEHANAGLRPDFYVLALDLEQATKLIENVHASEEAPDFRAVSRFFSAAQADDALKTMTGVQLFFDAKTSIGRGHMYFPFSELGLSSISQSEFWSTRGSFADGYFGVLSVDVCTVHEDGLSHWVKGEDPAAGDPFDWEGRALDDDEKDRLARFHLTRSVWREIESRISEGDEVAAPRCFHVDRAFTLKGNKNLYLACTPNLDAHRPGRVGDLEAVGRHEIRYSINHKRWVLCGAYMATHTRMTTMEAANESARHAVRAILKRLAQNDADELPGARFEGEHVAIDSPYNKIYNGASGSVVYDPPDTWNPEEDEIEDLDLFRRVDRRLVAAGMPHILDILDFDRRLKHAQETAELYGDPAPLRELFTLGFAGLDAVMRKELGAGYAEPLSRPARDTKQALDDARAKLQHPVFEDIDDLRRRLEDVLRRLF